VSAKTTQVDGYAVYYGMNENDDFALVPTPPSALERMGRGEKRILTAMVAELLALAPRNPSPSVVETLTTPSPKCAGDVVINAGKILFEFPQTAQRLTREFELKWYSGLRNSLLIVRVAKQFVSNIQITCGNETADGKSIMSVMMLALHYGWYIKVSAAGPDAKAAMDAMTELFSCGPRMDRCPKPGCSERAMLIDHTRDFLSYACVVGHAWDVRRSDASMAFRPDLPPRFVHGIPIER